ncbi:MAG: hypothetical protein U0X20_00710 [Caldilineaceae bacterium]
MSTPFSAVDKLATMLSAACATGAPDGDPRGADTRFATVWPRFSLGGTKDLLHEIGGDAVAYLRQHHGLSYTAACETLRRMRTRVARLSYPHLSLQRIRCLLPDVAVEGRPNS